MEDGSVDLILTDPPYDMNTNYGNGSAKHIENYNDWIIEVFSRCGRVLSDGGFLVFTNTVKFLLSGVEIPKPLRYFHLGVWHKSFSTRPSFYGISPHWEPIFFYFKTKLRRDFRRRDKCVSDVFEGMMQPGTATEFGHPTSKPMKLWKHLLAFGSESEDDIIYDPFLGSGTTAVAAERLGRKWVGSEINPQYVAVSERRIANERAQLKLAI